MQKATVKHSTRTDVYVMQIVNAKSQLLNTEHDIPVMLCRYLLGKP